MKAWVSWPIQDGVHGHERTPSTYTHGGAWVGAMTLSTFSHRRHVFGQTVPRPVVELHTHTHIFKHTHLPLAEVLQILPGSVEVVPPCTQGSQSHLRDR